MKRTLLVLFLCAALLVLLLGLSVKAYMGAQLSAREYMAQEQQKYMDFFLPGEDFVPGNYEFDSSWLPEDELSLIAHAMGGIDGESYTNSLEAMELAYEKGLRVFEGDLALLDGRVMLIHDYNMAADMCSLELSELDSRSFLASKLYGKYTPMAIETVLEFMAAHPDMYFMTDIKDFWEPGFSTVIKSLVSQAQAIDHSLPDRFIIQIYSRTMLDPLMEIYPFKSVLYTLYQTPDGPEQVMDFCQKSGVNIVTMAVSVYSDDFVAGLKELGVKILVHTVNEPELVELFRAGGVSGLYTDFLTPAAVS